MIEYFKRISKLLFYTFDYIFNQLLTKYVNISIHLNYQIQEPYHIEVFSENKTCKTTCEVFC